MCTLLTVDRFFYHKNIDAVQARIKSDAVSNDDGWSIVFLGENRNDTVLMQSLELSSILSAIDTVPWTRFFLHSRLSTTSTEGIFGCHNFTSVGNGTKNNVANGYWIVQHNGILRNPRAYEYMVDSMLIPEFIREIGIAKTIDYLLDEEVYANVFLINPLTGRYIVTRSQTNTLFSDGLGNYSTNAVESIRHPVMVISSHDHVHIFIKPKKSHQHASYLPSEALKAWEVEANLHSATLEKECKEWGTRVFEHINSLPLFHQACVYLGFIGGPKPKLMNSYTFAYLSTQQKKWARTLGIAVNKSKKVSY